MDPLSLITQVNGPVGLGTEEPKKSPNSEESCDKVAKCDDSSNRPSGPTKMNSENENKNKSVDCSTSTSARIGGDGGGGGGSRFLSQLLCCFGLGHMPDYAVSQQQQQQQLHHHHDEPAAHDSQRLSLVPAAAPSSEADCASLQSPPHAAAACLLASAEADLVARICAVIDLDETLVHSSFRSTGASDFVIEVEVDTVLHRIYVLKRPYVDEFLARMGQLFECVLFTASMGKYADPVSDLIDPGGAFKHRLFRESCVYHCDNYVKDLSALGRPIDRCVIIDNSPASYMFNEENAIRVQSWMGEPDDTELRDLLPYMEALAKADSVSAYLRNNPPPQTEPLTMEQMMDQMQEMEDNC